MTKIPEGVYSESKIQKIGTMSTSRTQQVVDYYRCVQIDDNTVSIQILDMYGDVLPLVEKIALADFLKRFSYEPDKFQHKMTPNDLAVEKSVSTAENHFKRKEYFSAEFEFSKALKLDEENVRANFGLGKVYIETGERQKAAEVFSKLSNQENMLEPENKHLFNELGIELRGLGLYEQALEFYQKALNLSRDDENLYFNLARAALEGGNKDRAREALERALTLNPNFEPAKKLLHTL